jgi:cystathionine gamma-synthase
MNARDLLQEPVWQAAELGHPIPPSTHAISVALPRWQDVVGYEEKKPEVLEQLISGYPRFKIHALVLQIAREIGKGEPCLPFPSARTAELCADFIRRTSGAEARVTRQRDIHGVVTNAAGKPALLTFWQHTGLIVSTRQAEAHLAGSTGNRGGAELRRSLREQLAGFYDCKEDDVYLAPTGMAAIFAALQAVKERSPGRPTAQLGFPYVDSLKLQEKFGHGGILLHDLESAGQELTALLQRKPLAACFCEIPGNPLLGSVDLRDISPALHEQRVPLVVDDVVATPINVDLSAHADLIATSLTKFIVGTCDAMGGALICNPKSPLYDELKSIARAQHEELLWSEDARVLDDQARSFPERMKRHNENGLYIAERLRRHPAVERVWYPKWESGDAYEAVRRPGGGWGALVTFLPKNGETRSPIIYDRLEVCKGPSLGAVFTLACPFTLLAHYTELDWAEACGVSRYLIRLSVGLEDPEELWQRFEMALAES